MTNDERIISSRDKFLLILMGFVVFSTFSGSISSFFGFPITMPEPFFLVFLLLLKDRFLPVSIDKDLFFILVIVLFFSVIISQFASSYSLYAVLSSARGYLYLFLFYAIYKKKNKLAIDDLLYISFGTLIGWSAACVMTFQNILSNPNENYQTYGNMITVALFISISILERRWKLFTIGMAFLVIICFMSGIRRVIAVILLAMVLALLFQYLKSRRSFFRLIITVALIVVPFFIIVPKIGHYAEDNVPALYYRLFTKSERFLSGDTDVSDEYRKESIRTFKEEIGSYMLPQGMVSNQYLTDEGTGIYMDFPLLALSHIFSFPVTVLIVFLFMIKTFKCYLFYRKTSDIAAGVYSIVTIVMFLLLFVEGSFLVHPYTTPFTGLCLGKVSYYGRKYNAIKQ